LQGHRIKLKRKKEKKRKTKQQNRRQSVVAGRQQLYCAVRSRSPNHCRTTTEKVQSSARDGTDVAGDAVQDGVTVVDAAGDEGVDKGEQRVTSFYCTACRLELWDSDAVLVTQK